VIKSHLLGTTKRGESALTPALVPAIAPTDPDLSSLIAAWPTLPPALKAGIVAMVKAAGGGRSLTPARSMSLTPARGQAEPTDAANAT
jgi:hypothetical protein